MNMENPPTNEEKLPIDKFLNEHPGFAKDAVPRVIEGDNSKNLTLEELKDYIDDTHGSGSEK